MNKTSWDMNFRYIIVVFLVLSGLFLIWYFQELINPLIIAALMAYFLNPLSKLLIVRWRIRPKVATNFVYFVVLALLFALPFTVLPLLFNEFQNIAQDLFRALDELQGILTHPILIGNLNIDLGSIIPAIRTALKTGYVPEPQDALNILEAISRNFLWMLVVLVTAYYLMTDWEGLRNSMISLAPKGQQEELNHLYRDIRLIWNSYLLGQVRLIFILIIIYTVTWSAIGLPGAVALGILAGVLNLLPEVGPGAIAIIAVVVAFLEGSTYLPISNLWFAVLTLGVYLLLNNIKTLWLQPRILGNSVRMHEGLVFVAIVTAVILQGMLGVLVVVPLLATLAIVGRYLRSKLLDLPPFEDDEPAFMHNLASAEASTGKATLKKSATRKKFVK